MRSKSRIAQLGRRGWLLALAAACGDASPPTSDDAAPPPVVADDAAARKLTLITGDRVIVARDGGVRVEPGPGRERVGFTTQRHRGETIVLPRDALPLVASGQLDSELFNVTRLLAQNYDDAHCDDLPLIVTGPLDGAAARGGIASSALVVDRIMPAVGAVAARQRKGAASTILADLAAAPAQKIWLDRRYEIPRDRGAPQINASPPRASQVAGTGAGVVVAIIDTGVDAEHPDLTGKVLDAVTFMDDGAGTSDVFGRGTFVASIVAGTGAASGGEFRGVAPGADLISARVCSSTFCSVSALLAGMEWAVVEKGAKIINVSFGAQDIPGVDPVEEAVNRLSAEHGALFVVSAGDRGVGLDSPGSADAALTAGAVDNDGQRAFFSGRGPRLGDLAIKPDLVAPGVAIVGARAAVVGDAGDPVGTAYLRASGTGFASAHVAGAAAILREQHADWSGPQIKAALVGSAAPLPALTVFEQGAGHVDLARAARQTVAAAPVSASFGTARWPHDDDPLVRSTVTYHNTGAAPITLAVSGSLAHQGVAAAGMLLLSASEITVPAGGTADLVVGVDTTGDRPDGIYTGTLVATAGDVRAVTPIAVEREVPSSDLTIEMLDRHGSQMVGAGVLFNAEDFRFIRPPTTLRLPHGPYTVEATPFTLEPTVMFYPRLELSEPTTIVMDGRLAHPATISVAEQPLELESLEATYLDSALDLSFVASNLEQFSTAHIGPAAAPGEIHSYLIANLIPVGATDARSFYLFGHRERDRFVSGMTANVTAEQLATVHTRHRGDADRRYRKFVLGSLDDLPEQQGLSKIPVADAVYQGPADRTEHYFGAGFKWGAFLQQVREIDGELERETETGHVLERYRAGRTSVEHWHRAPFGPAFGADLGQHSATRSGDLVGLSPTMFSEVSAPSRIGRAQGSQRFTLYRDGELLFDALDDDGFGELDTFDLPAERATYRFEVEATRPPEVAELSPRVTAAWTFASEHVAGNELLVLPLPVLRFAPQLDEQNRARRKLPLILPVDIERPAGAATPAIAHVSVEASFDDGATWSKVFGVQIGARWFGVILHPANAAYVSLRGSARDVDGNRVDQTIIRAYALAP